MNIATLRQDRATKTTEMRALVAGAELASRDLNETETSRFDALHIEARALESNISRREALDQLEREAPARAIDGETRDRSDIAARFNFGEALADHSEGREMRGAAREWNSFNKSTRSGFSVPVETFLGGETRAVTTTTPVGSVGGNLIATTQGQFIDRLRPNLAVERMGATILRGLVGNLELPRQKTSGAAAWTAEHVNATRTDAGFDKLALSPKTLSAEYEVSRRMLLQAPQLDSLLRNDLAQILAAALDLAAITGSGGTQPTGVLNTAGIFTHAGATNGLVLSLDTAPDLIGALDAADANGPRGFLANAKTRKAAMKLRDTTGQPFGVPSVFANEPVSFSTQVPGTLTKGTGTGLSAMIYGAWQDLVVAYWSSVDIVANPYHSDVASKGGLILHAFLDADIAVRNAASFAVTKDLIA